MPRRRRLREPESPSDGFRPLRAVIDSNVFPHQEWIRPILAAARDGYLDPMWSPCIVAEATRLLTWRWLRRNGGELSRASWRACSNDFKAWFAYMTAGFLVVEDRPPGEALWSATPPDEWDLPIWNAAVRSNASFVVTENLRDGPPEDASGRREYRGVVYLHPSDFLEHLDRHVDSQLAVRLSDVGNPE